MMWRQWSILLGTQNVNIFLYLDLELWKHLEKEIGARASPGGPPRHLS